VRINRDEKNLDKTRYRDVIPGEATRVKLRSDGEDKHDFINANYVSGYNNQDRAYIFTQGNIGDRLVLLLILTSYH
jgi:protein tyrosine phosphatase